MVVRSYHDNKSFWTCEQIAYIIAQLVIAELLSLQTATETSHDWSDEELYASQAFEEETTGILAHDTRTGASAGLEGPLSKLVWCYFQHVSFPLTN